MTEKEIKDIFGRKSIEFKNNIIVKYPGVFGKLRESNKSLEYDARDTSFTIYSYYNSYMYWSYKDIKSIEIIENTYNIKLKSDIEIIFDKLPNRQS